MLRLLVILLVLFPSLTWASAYRDSTTNTGNGTALSVTAPTGTVAGDIVILLTQINNGTETITDNNGGTPFAEDIAECRPVSSPSMTISFWSRRIVGGDPSSYAFTASGAASDWRVTAVTVQSPHGSIIYDAGPTQNCQGSLSTLTALGLTTSSNNALLYVFFASDSSTATFSSPPSGYTERENSGGAERPHWVGEKVKTPAGVESDQTIVQSTSVQWSAVLAAIEEPVSSSRPVAPFFLGWVINPLLELWSLLEDSQAHAY